MYAKLLCFRLTGDAIGLWAGAIWTCRMAGREPCHALSARLTGNCPNYFEVKHIQPTLKGWELFC
ncbi:hypothetical protein [Mesorhizobium cantuariense]|uniref:Secreted protein n=1 Tax=Mesorhizobium cantuariense TaxID=1300275 RepID=A0ABV7MIC3_9HYPH